MDICLANASNKSSKHFPMKIEELNAVYKLCDSKNEGKVGYDDFEKFIQGEGGVAADGTLVQKKAKPKRKEKNTR